jgi:hypothetical protein
MSLLPNFCQGYGSQHMDNHNQNQQDQQNNPDLSTGYSGPTDSVLYQRYLAQRRSGQSYQDWLNVVNGGFLPGTNPNNPLNTMMISSDGSKTFYSNTGADGRYKDNKATYMKDYITTINLGIGILVCLAIIAKNA